jgi:hypothetical protein
LCFRYPKKGKPLQGLWRDSDVLMRLSLRDGLFEISIPTSNIAQGSSRRWRLTRVRSCKDFKSSGWAKPVRNNGKAGLVERGLGFVSGKLLHQWIQRLSDCLPKEVLKTTFLVPMKIELSPLSFWVIALTLQNFLVNLFRTQFGLALKLPFKTSSSSGCILRTILPRLQTTPPQKYCVFLSTPSFCRWEPSSNQIFPLMQCEYKNICALNSTKLYPWSRVLFQLVSMGLDIRTFPFVQEPPSTNLNESLSFLQQQGALKSGNVNRIMMIYWYLWFTESHEFWNIVHSGFSSRATGTFETFPISRHRTFILHGTPEMTMHLIYLLQRMNWVR